MTRIRTIEETHAGHYTWSAVITPDTANTAPLIRIFLGFFSPKDQRYKLWFVRLTLDAYPLDRDYEAILGAPTHSFSFLDGGTLLRPAGYRHSDGKCAAGDRRVPTARLSVVGGCARAGDGGGWKPRVISPPLRITVHVDPLSLRSRAFLSHQTHCRPPTLYTQISLQWKYSGSLTSI